MMAHAGAPSTSAIRAGLAAAARYGAAAALVSVIVVCAWRLALAPVHGVRDTAACERAYAAARTRADSLSAAFLSYPDPAGRDVKRRCGELRATTVGELVR